jgi:hypothetical protein
MHSHPTGRDLGERCSMFDSLRYYLPDGNIDKVTVVIKFGQVLALVKSPASKHWAAYHL